MWNVLLVVFVGVAAVGVQSTTNMLSYISTHHAKSIDGEYDCIGDCVMYYDVDQCYITWHSGIRPCRADAKARTLRYNTLDGSRCISDCHFYGESFEWCVTEGIGWDYCSSRTSKFGYRVTRSNNPQAVCSDGCTHASTYAGYYWCNTVAGNWDYCTPGAMTHVFDYRAENGKTCIGVCGRKDNSVEAYCYTPGPDWSRCYPDPTPQPWYFEEINEKIRYNCSVYQDSDAGLFRCRNGRRVVKRQPPPYNEFNYDDCAADIENLLLSHQAYFPEVTVRNWDPANPITTHTDPIIEYCVQPTVSFFSDSNDVGINLPMNVRAVITRYTLDNRRERFNTETNVNYYAMDVGRDRPVNDYDERGHMIAARLGGPAAAYNIFPQTRSLNRGTGSLWNTLERQIEAWVRSDLDHRYAIMTVALSYDIRADMTMIHRPIGVAVRLEARDTRTDDTFYDVTTQTPVPSNGTNPHRSMFFSNELNNVCTPPANNG